MEDVPPLHKLAALGPTGAVPDRELYRLSNDMHTRLGLPKWVDGGASSQLLYEILQEVQGLIETYDLPAGFLQVQTMEGDAKKVEIVLNFRLLDERGFAMVREMVSRAIAKLDALARRERERIQKERDANPQPFYDMIERARARTKQRLREVEREKAKLKREHPEAFDFDEEGWQSLAFTLPSDWVGGGDEDAMDEDPYADRNTSSEEEERAQEEIEAAVRGVAPPLEEKGPPQLQKLFALESSPQYEKVWIKKVRVVRPELPEYALVRMYVEWLSRRWIRYISAEERTVALRRFYGGGGGGGGGSSSEAGPSGTAPGPS